MWGGGGSLAGEEGGGGSYGSVHECWVDAGHVTASYSDRWVVS
jgi:hypothetical protein